MKNETYMVFDVESIGLHGEGFSVGYVVIENEREVESGYFKSNPYRASGTREDYEWAESNTIPVMDLYAGGTYGNGFGAKTPRGMREAFWNRYMAWRGRDVILAADCPWPVESRFLHDCIRDYPTDRAMYGPYPLLDVASVRLAAGLDPLGTEERIEGETPKHHPLADARQSSRLLVEALRMARREESSHA